MTLKRNVPLEFREAIVSLANEFAQVLWTEVVEGSSAKDADERIKEIGGALLRCMLGTALSARAERLGTREECSECGEKVEFRERKRRDLHTVVAGRDVDVRVLFGQCLGCGKWNSVLLDEMAVDPEGFTPGLRSLALLAAVIEPYEQADVQLLRRFAGVHVSHEKMHALVRDAGAEATEFLRDPTSDVAPQRVEAPTEPLYVEVDGGMISVDKRWQEVKLGCLFDGDAVAEISAGRRRLTQRQIVAVRGTPEDLQQTLWPRAMAAGCLTREVVVLGDGATWIWNLADELFPRRTEILDWYHADEHIGVTARLLYGEGMPRAQEWCEKYRHLLMNDQVDEAIRSLESLALRQRVGSKRKAVSDLAAYMTKNRHRMKYLTFRQRGLQIGSGVVESAVGHVVQQRMKRAGMRWKSAGADAMLALRSVYRSTGCWDRFVGSRAAA